MNRIPAAALLATSARLLHASHNNICTPVSFCAAPQPAAGQMLRTIQCLCQTRLAGVLASRSQAASPNSAARLAASRSSHRTPLHRHRSYQQAARCTGEGQATLSRPAQELAPTQQAAAPTLRELEEQLGPFSAARSVPPPPPLVIIISGPSGVGKDAVINRLRERRTDIHFVVTATSRPKREGEVHGVDYFFVSKGQFEEWLAAGDALLEHAVVYGDYKGIPRQQKVMQVVEALANDTDVVLRIDVQGAATVRGMIPDAVSIFLAAESEAKLVQRLVARKTETLSGMAARIKTARSEAARMSEFDYVVVNEDGRLEETVLEIEAILTAEKDRVARRRLAA